MAPESTDSGPITFVNQFTVHGSPEEFERAFADTATFLTEQPGLLEYTLLRQQGRQDAYINIARWRSLAALKEAAKQPAFEAHATALRALATSQPTVYSPRRTYTAAAN